MPNWVPLLSKLAALCLVQVVLLVVANPLWVRGTDAGQRWQEARRRWGLGGLAGAVAGLALALGAGGFVFYNTNVLNHYQSPKAQEAAPGHL